MITQLELDEVIDNLQVRPVHHGIMVLIPVVSETTDSGIIKGDTLMAEDESNKDSFHTVIAVAEDVTTIKVGDKVFIQGTVTTFGEETMPPELDIAPAGYTIGFALDMYIKMVI